LLKAQILALLLIPFLSGAAPRDGATVSPLSLLGIEEYVTSDFIVGQWRYSDEFFRWGVTDRERSRIRPVKGQGSMTLNADGTVKMSNLFKPDEGYWEITPDGIKITDPKLPDHTPQLLPIRKRDADHIWVLLPFTGGAAGIGMARVVEGAAEPAVSDKREEIKPEPKQQRPRRSVFHDRRPYQRWDRPGAMRSEEKESRSPSRGGLGSAGSATQDRSFE
jgi:hypothetical protein